MTRVECCTKYENYITQITNKEIYSQKYLNFAHKNTTIEADLVSLFPNSDKCALSCLLLKVQCERTSIFVLKQWEVMHKHASQIF